MHESTDAYVKDEWMAISAGSKWLMIQSFANTSSVLRSLSLSTFFFFITLLRCNMMLVQGSINVLSLSCWGGKCLAQLKHGCMQNHAWTDPLNMKNSLACHTGLSNNGLFDEVEAIVQSFKGEYIGQDHVIIKIAYWQDPPLPDEISERPEHWLFQRLSCQIVLWCAVC